MGLALVTVCGGGDGLDRRTERAVAAAVVADPTAAAAPLFPLWFPFDDVSDGRPTAPPPPRGDGRPRRRFAPPSLSNELVNREYF